MIHILLSKSHSLRLLLITFLLTSDRLLTSGSTQHHESTDAVANDLLNKGDVSITKCDLNSECDQNIKLDDQPDLDNYGATPEGHSDWSSLGLRSSNLHVNDIAVGFVPAFNEKLSPNNPLQINAKLPKPMSIVGDYVEIEPWSSKMANLDWHLPMIKQLEGNPVWCIALMPTQGLETITYKVAHRIAQKMKAINDQGVTVWLRFGHEMNGEWYRWGMKPELFVEKWNLLGGLVKSIASRTYMLWSPNAAFGKSVHDVHGGYTPYWPGGDHVDIVGVSFYHWGSGYQRVNIAPNKDEVVGKIHDFNMLYGSGGWGKPVIIAETAASYTYNPWTKLPVGGGATEYDIKMTWLHLLLDRYVKRVVPNLRAMIWFEVIKNENATGDTPVHTEDFRLVLGNRRLSWAASNYFTKRQ